jgi:SpoVK/Ycf46/Vps4 family AAA+-type ATPase
MFLTTNHIEKLDHALLRIGRVDYILEFDLPKKSEVKKLFFDIFDKRDNKEKSEKDLELEKDFNEFYESVRSKNLPMAAIVNYLFLNKNNWKENINELINTNNFIKKVLKTDVDKSLYS